MSQIDLKKVNSALKSREKRIHQNVAPVSKEFKELSAKKARLEVRVGLLQRDARKVLGARQAVPAKPSPSKPIPAKKALASRKVFVDGAEVILGPGEEICRLVNPKPKKKI